jgi:signal peptidase I
MSAVAEAVNTVRPKLRTRIWVILISLFVPGLGQAFLSRYRRGAIFTRAVVIAALILKASVFLWPVWRPAVLPFILIAFAAGVVIVLWAAIDSWRCAGRAAVLRPTWPKRYLVYSAMILAWFAPNAIALGAPSWRAFSTPSASMVPNLQPGDYFFVLDGYYAQHEPQRGDLVVFKLPCQYPLLDRATAKSFEERCDGSIDFVKRIVGLPGDKIQMKGGILNVNRQAVKRDRLQPYLYTDDNRTSTYAQYVETFSDGYRDNILEIDDHQPLDNTDEFTVPPRSYFMMGDNRDDSADSREPMSGVGFVPRDRLIGKAALIYFSIDGRPARGRNASWLPLIRWGRIGMPLS